MHYGYLLLVPVSFGLMALSRPGALRIVAGVLAIVGTVTLSGAVSVDFFDLALAQTLPMDKAVDVSEHAGELGGAIAFYAPGMIGSALGLILLGVSAWRSGVAQVWLPAGIVAAIVVVAMDASLTFAIAGGGILLAAMGGTGVQLLRGERAAAPSGAAVPAVA